MCSDSNEIIYEGDFWGVCPKCLKNDGCFDVGEEHYFACHTHKVKWHCWSGKYDDERNQEEKEKEENNRRLLETYKDITPIWGSSCVVSFRPNSNKEDIVQYLKVLNKFLDKNWDSIPEIKKHKEMMALLEKIPFTF